MPRLRQWRRLMPGIYPAVLLMCVYCNMYLILTIQTSSPTDLELVDCGKCRYACKERERNDTLKANASRPSAYSPIHNTSAIRATASGIIQKHGRHDITRIQNAPRVNTSEHQSEHTVDIAWIKKDISRINREQTIYNIHRFGLHLNSTSVVIVIQVHDRLEYLEVLLQSLQHVRNIERSLLIISHDFYSEPMNRLVRSVSYCPVLQIFYPFSLQLHPSSFPGTAPNDCPSRIRKDDALKKNCTNADSPDKFGHYREGKFCQPKHHWIWKLNHVFDGIAVTEDYQGLVLLLEDDYYVTPDIITVTQMMENQRSRDCEHCKMLALGNFDKKLEYKPNASVVVTENWVSQHHNMGMAFKRDMWEEIKKYSREFCTFDDYNWDYTLHELSLKHIPGNIKVLKVKATRVFHMGACGIHHKEKKCNIEQKTKSVQDIINKNEQYLFPRQLNVSPPRIRKVSKHLPNGGWADSRDIQLCMSYMNHSMRHIG